MTTAYAAPDKPISSVKLQFTPDLEVGDKIGDASIDIDSTTAPGGGIAISGVPRSVTRLRKQSGPPLLQRSVGYPPELKIRLEVADSDYAFKGIYRSGQCQPSRVLNSSARRAVATWSSKAKLKPIKGELSRHRRDAYWKGQCQRNCKMGRTG